MMTRPLHRFSARASLGPLLLVLLCFRPAQAQVEPAQDQEAEEAQAAFDRAVKLSEAHRYAEALKELEGAAAMDPSPPILLNLGRMREETGDAEGAMRAYRELLQRNRRSRLRPEAETRLHALEEAKAKAKSKPEEKTPKSDEKTPEPPPAAPKLQPLPEAACPPRTAGPSPVTRPLYKRWWFWAATVGGAVVLSGAAVGLTLALSQKDPPPAPATDLGNMRFFLP